MIRFLVDENYNNDILRGVIRRAAGLDAQRAQDVGLKGASDPDVLEWAAREGRVMLTHDVATLVPLAHDRVLRGLLMPGVVVSAQIAPIAPVVEDLVLLAECGEPGDCRDRVIYLPLRS